MSNNALLAPLSNRMHLVTIILVAVLFGVLRLSGGGVDSKSRPQVSNTATAGAAGLRSLDADESDSTSDADIAEEKPAKANVKSAAAMVADVPESLAEQKPEEAVVPHKASNPASNGSKGDLLDEMMSRDKAERKRQAEEAARKEPAKLDDIQKMLGLK